jgi:hypothetical protein
MYKEKEQKKLLELARKSIESEFSGEKSEIPEQFTESRGVFVTLYKNPGKKLRGCIGFPEPRIPLNKAIPHLAKAAAFEDPRFSPLEKYELNQINIEISILTTPVLCKEKDVKIGEDGLVCEFNGYSGLLLPQVAVIHKMNKHEFIEALCNKAGISKQSCKEQGFKLYKFQAQVFQE